MTSTSRYAGRSTRRFRTLRDEFRRRCKAQETPCWLCGKPIDYTLARQHPEAFNLDHAIARAARPDLAEDPNNFRPAHKVCNERRGSAAPTIDIGAASEPW